MQQQQSIIYLCSSVKDAAIAYNRQRINQLEYDKLCVRGVIKEYYELIKEASLESSQRKREEASVGTF